MIFSHLDGEIRDFQCIISHFIKSAQRVVSDSIPLLQKNG